MYDEDTVVSIPVALLVSHISQYLDRTSWNELSLTKKDLHAQCKQLSCPCPWPERRFRLPDDAFAVDFAPALKEKPTEQNNKCCSSTYERRDAKRMEETFAVGCRDGSISFWHCLVGRYQVLHEVHSTLGVTCVSFCPSNPNLLASSGRDEYIRLWNATPVITSSLNTEDDCSINPRRLAHWKDLRIDMAWIYSVSFSPDGEYLVSGSNDNRVRIWNVDLGTCARILSHRDFVLSVAFSPDGTRVASCSSDRCVRYWKDLIFRADTSTSNSRRIRRLTAPSFDALRGHTAEVYCVKFTPDGRFLATASADGTVRLWDTLHVGDATSDDSDSDDDVIFTRQSRVLKSTTTSEAWSISFSVDGTLMVCGYRDGTIKAWNIARADDNVGADFSEKTVIAVHGRHCIRELAISPYTKTVVGACGTNVLICGLRGRGSEKANHNA